MFRESNCRLGCHLLAALLAVGWLLPARCDAQSVVLQPVADTFISESWPERNFGAMPFLNGGTTQSFTTNRALMRFNLAGAIPPDALILEAWLTVEVVGQPDEPWNSADFGLYRLLRDWGEGDNFATLPRNAAPAGLNEANWTHRFAGTAATWGVPGGEPGVDYFATRSTGEFVYGAGLPYTFASTPQLVADVQLWVNQPGSNFGWMLAVQNETTDFTARRFGAREDAFNAPSLNISFIRVPEPSSSALLVLGLGMLLRCRLRPRG